LAIFTFACNNSSDQDDSQVQDSTAISELTVDDLMKAPGDFVDKTVKVEGTVTHVCKHGGKRMFLIGTNPDVDIKIVTGDDASAFDVALEGSDLIVEGIVEELRIDENYLNEWEAEVNAENDKPAVTTEHQGKSSEADQGTHTPALDEIAEYRAELKETGKPYLAFYSLKCIKYEEKKQQ